MTNNDEIPPCPPTGVEKMIWLVQYSLIPTLRLQPHAELGGWDWHGMANQLEQALRECEGMPSIRGFKEYPPSGTYEGETCTCKDECPTPCRGQCGCKACHACYSDFLSGE